MEYNLFLLLKKSVDAHPDAIACQIKGAQGYKTFSYREIYQLALKFACFLKRQSLQRQDRVAIILENSPYWPAAYFGIAASGFACVPIDPKLTPAEMNNIIRDSQSKILFTSKDILLPAQNSLKNILSLKKIVFYPFPEIESFQPGEAFIEASPDDTASILYTSGTTASPKGVCLSHKNFCANFDSLCKLKIIHPEDNLLSLLPLHHSYPFMVTMLTPLFSGAKITYLNSLKSEDIIKCLKETNISILVGVPQLFNMLHKAIKERLKNKALIFFLKCAGLTREFIGLNLNKIILGRLHANFGSRLRYFISGGARLDPSVAGELTLFGFSILEGYGLTETSPVVTFNPPQRPVIGSVGKAIPGVKIKINTKFPADKTGEILIQGPNVMKGYFRKAQETQEILKDGWLYSGDLGCIDKKGYLYITGRIKEVIVLSSGKNIFPEEIENHYLKTPYIKEICVFDELREGALSLWAAVVPNTDYFRKTKEVNIQDKIRWLMENLSKELPSYKRIMGFTIAKEDLPKTRLGKLKRYEIKGLFESGKTPRQEYKEYNNAHQLAPIEKKIIEFLSKELKRSIRISDHLELDLGIDSLSRIELGIGLEKYIGMPIPDHIIAEVFTIKELIAEIQNLTKGQEISTQEVIPGAPISWDQILQEKSGGQIRKSLRISPAIYDKITAWIILSWMHFIFRIVWLLRIKGKKNLPGNQAVIICPNHSSFLDGFVIASSAGIAFELNLFFLGYSGYFLHPILRRFSKTARLVAIDPSLNLSEALAASSYILKNNKALCIFPEGERSIDGEIKTFKKGAGILISQTNVPVVPCYIKGSFQAWPRGRAFMLPYPIIVSFGKPCSREELKQAGLKYKPTDDYEAIAAGLREKVIELSVNTPKNSR